MTIATWYRDGDVIIYEENEVKYEVPFNSSVSMNFWCFHPTLFSFTEELFHRFVKENSGNIKAEFFIPIIAEEFMEKKGGIKVIPTSAQWFGVTYKEDAPGVKNSVDALVAAGEYPPSLWK